MKKLVLFAALSVSGYTKLNAQANCDLINSATLSVPANDVNVARYSNQRGPTLPYQYLTYDQWHHMAITKQNLNGKVFLDGVLVIDSLWSNNPFNWTSLYLGAELFTGWSVFYKGMLDEIRISNIVRSDNDIINAYIADVPYLADANTMALWHFDELSGSNFLNSSTLQNSGILYNGVTFQQGKFGNGIYFDGINDRADCSFNMPENNFTIEFWIKPSQQSSYSCFMLPYGSYNSPMYLTPDTISTNYTWSTGATGNSVTVDPSTVPYVWVTDGNCTDTVWFDSQSATVYDTVYTTITDTVYTTVTDTLIINTSLGLPAPNNSNTILVFPNPASTHVTIDYGNFALMNGYQLRIENSVGQQVFQTNISQQSDFLSLATWGGNGLYYVHIIDPQGNTIDIRKIVLQ